MAAPSGTDVTFGSDEVHLNETATIDTQDGSLAQGTVEFLMGEAGHRGWRGDY